MKIYTKFKNLGDESDTFAAIKISTEPFGENCWVTEFEDNIQLYFEELSDLYKSKWNPYNTIVSTYNSDSDTFTCVVYKKGVRTDTYTVGYSAIYKIKTLLKLDYYQQFENY